VLWSWLLKSAPHDFVELFVGSLLQPAHYLIGATFSWKAFAHLYGCFQCLRKRSHSPGLFAFELRPSVVVIW
jgi:hypothetical protein